MPGRATPPGAGQPRCIAARAEGKAMGDHLHLIVYLWHLMIYHTIIYLYKSVSFYHINVEKYTIHRAYGYKKRNTESMRH